MIDFKHLNPPGTPNNFFAAPQSLGNKQSNYDSPVFVTDNHSIIDALYKIATSEPRTKLLKIDRDKGRMEFLQRSLIFRFPDYIDLEILEIEDNYCSVNIYSRSKYGSYDFGVNKKRVVRWMENLRNLFKVKNG
tara:strand:- start:86438 stop:86839 length:402 start_codon:yes stop_codon:yes gene_type:complete